MLRKRISGFVEPRLSVRHAA